jgi:formylglycine-generating enzyme required for sulfatase activity
MITKTKTALLHLFLLITSHAVTAGEGALALTTEPRDAEIRVDGELKAMSTPVVLKLPAGKHQLEATAGDKSASLEVFIPADGVISKKLTLEGSAPVVVATSPIDYYRPERDSFETEAEFAARKEKLRQQIDAAVEARKKAFIAGTATLDKSGYDIKTGVFPLTIKWTEWAKALDYADQGVLTLDRDPARQLWREGAEKPLFIDGDSNLQLIGLGKAWELGLPRWRDPITGLEFVRIPKGCFQMGSPSDEKGRRDNERQHRVCVDAFWISTTEVTNRQYRLFKPDHDSKESSAHDLNGEEQPAVHVSWRDALAFADWLGDQSSGDFGLPTEAQWEYAARAGSQTRYWWGDQAPVCEAGRRNGAKFDDNAQCDDTGTEPVATYQANPFGLYDVHGNVWEWTCSEYDEDYGGKEQRCISDSSNKERRVLRGGSWFNDPGDLRSALRGRYRPADRDGLLGFRLSRSAP